MSDQKARLREINAQIEALEEKRREIYRASMHLPDDEKVCSDAVAQMLGMASTYLIKYPIEVTGINFAGRDVRYPYDGARNEAGQFVKVRPCADEYGNKTYLGIYLGDLAVSTGASYDRKSGVLTIGPGTHNPAIWVPALRKIIFGMESWWGHIESPEQLRDITDADINNVWYVQALRSLTGETP